MHLDETHENSLKQAAQALLERVSEARVVIVATEDGFALTHAAREAVDPARIAAITSSMSAIGAVISQETGIGQVRSLVVDANDGFLVMRSCRSQRLGIVIAMLVAGGGLLGLAIHAVGDSAKELSAA